MLVVYRAMAAELRIGAQLPGAMRTDAKELKAVRLYVERQPNYRLDRLPFLVAYCVPALIVARDVAGGHACAAALFMTLTVARRQPMLQSVVF